MFADVCFEFVSGRGYFLLRLSNLFFGHGEQSASMGSRKRGHSSYGLVLSFDGSAHSAQESLALRAYTDVAESLAILPRWHFGLTARPNGYVGFCIAFAKQFFAIPNARQSRLNGLKHVEFACSAF